MSIFTYFKTSAAGTDVSFLKYLAGQKWLLVQSLITFVALYGVLTFLFPLPDFFVDSFTYVDVANRHVNVSYRPLGYSDFLRMVHGISPNCHWLVFVQLFLFYSSTLLTFFSLDYLYGLPKKWSPVVFYLLLINPLLVLQANLVSSDSLFCSLTMVWISLCIWIINRPGYILAVLHTVVLFLCFYTRYTAIFYPVIACVVFLIAKGRYLYKITSVLVTLALIIGYVKYQEDTIERSAGVRVFSGFSGWQIANNVLCYYNKIDVHTEALGRTELQSG